MFKYNLDLLEGTIKLVHHFYVRIACVVLEAIATFLCRLQCGLPN